MVLRSVCHQTLTPSAGFKMGQEGSLSLYLGRAGTSRGFLRILTQANMCCLRRAWSLGTVSKAHTLALLITGGVVLNQTLHLTGPQLLHLSAVALVSVLWCSGGDGRSLSMLCPELGPQSLVCWELIPRFIYSQRYLEAGCLGVTRVR